MYRRRLVVAFFLATSLPVAFAQSDRSAAEAVASNFLQRLDSGDLPSLYRTVVSPRFKTITSETAFAQNVGMIRIQLGGPAATRRLVGAQALDQIPGIPDKGAFTTCATTRGSQSAVLSRMFTWRKCLSRGRWLASGISPRLRNDQGWYRPQYRGGVCIGQLACAVNAPTYSSVVDHRAVEINPCRHPRDIAAGGNRLHRDEAIRHAVDAELAVVVIAPALHTAVDHRAAVSLLRRHFRDIAAGGNRLHRDETL